MGNIRAKILFTLFVFGAGFGTAVYMMTPSDAQAAGKTPSVASKLWHRQAQSQPEDTGVEAKEWAVAVRTGIDKCIHFAEENALRAAELIRQKGARGNSESRPSVPYDN